MNVYGFLFDLSPWIALAASLVAFVTLGFLQVRLRTWTLAVAIGLFAWGAPMWVWIAFGVLAPVFNLRPLRRTLLSRPILTTMRKLKFLPVISETERTAIEAGTVWVDGDLFSGQPDFKKLSDQSYPGLTEDEQAFLDGPVEDVCRMCNDWEVWQERDLPDEIWDFLKEHRFLGLIIPKEYGGLGFSASANSAVVQKLSSRSTPLSITTMVPNSLGPAELLIHYGTQEQRDHYLPRLARGEDIPAFALTEPGAGSDAGAIEANGVVFRGEDGELYLRLNWKKRYITLAAISTVLGLAFKLRDPDNLLERGEELGITCALIPTSTEGVELGQRHDPLGVPFYNCPTEGHDVVVPLDAIIGGVEGAGDGWKMLMESLAAGRGISLPALGAAGAKMTARVAGAYAAVRKQFGLPIGKFEGIEEPLSRIGTTAYLLEAARRYTCGGLDTGAKPAVVTAIAKHTFTEEFRSSINDAMDICGGAGISLGPRNTLAHAYIGTPISITVEGANILTRTLMIFGQGAIRCHPYAYREIQSAAANDADAFDLAFWGHVGHVVVNGCRSVVLSLSRGRLAKAPVDGPTAEYYRKLEWSSASFAFLADVAMALYGGDLKRKESVTGRFSDIFSWMYMGNAVLRRFEAEGRRAEDLPFLHSSMQTCLERIQRGFDAIYANFHIPVVGLLFRGPVALWSRMNPISRGVTDPVAHRVAVALQTHGAQRDAMTRGTFRPDETELGLGVLERAFRLCSAVEPVADKIKSAVRARRLPRKAPVLLIDEALEAGIISAEEAEAVREAEEARDEAIQVDSFGPDEYMETARESEGDAPSSPEAIGA